LKLTLTLGLLSALFTPGCSSDAPSSGSAGAPRVVDPNARQIPENAQAFDCSAVSQRAPETLTVDEQTDEELGCYCDWSTTLTAGGYNISLACPPGETFYTSRDRATCVQEMRAVGARCAILVQDEIDCAREQADDPCNVLGNILSPACASVLACGN
jgi:hypothetical protein